VSPQIPTLSLVSNTELFARFLQAAFIFRNLFCPDKFETSIEKY
tara:strand:- start:514 stop:645 length:132 start_codon:yes stop_codon:yes gene_type:complete